MSTEDTEGWPAETELCRQHRESLQASAISPEVARARGYRTVHRPSMNAVLTDAAVMAVPSWARDRDRASTWPLLVIPEYTPTGAYAGASVRLATAVKLGERLAKYAHPKGSVNSLDVHPSNRDRVVDVTVPLFVVEGVKKADAVTSTGRCAVAVNGVYGWRRTSGAEAVWEGVPVKGRSVVLCFDSDTQERADLQRAIRRLGAWLASKGARVKYLVLPAIDAPLKTGIDDWLASGRKLEDLAAVATLTPPLTDEAGQFTDAKLADHFAEQVLADEFLFGRGIGWMRWDGRRWLDCGHEAALDALRCAARDQFDAMLDRAKADPGKVRIAQEFKKVLSASRLEAILKLCKGHALLQVDAADLDGDPHLLNVENGVVDLRTGELLAHDPALRMTRLAGAAYVAGHTDPLWDTTLQAVPEADREFLRDRVGQAITGDMTADDRIVFAQGGGANGKSTVFEAVLKASGGYGAIVPDKVLTARTSEHSTELTELRGIRLALLEELPDGAHVNRDRLVKLAGTPQMTARRIAQDSITWAASHSLFVTTNHQLDIKDVDHGTWRRLAFTRWPHKYVDVPTEPHELLMDPSLRERLLKSSSALTAVLAWAVAGAVAYYARGHMLPLPVALQVELDRRRDEVDTLGAFLRDRLEGDPQSCVWVDELAAQFARWSKDRGYAAISLTSFGGRLKAHPWAAEAGLSVGERVRVSTTELSYPSQREHIEIPLRIRVVRGVRFADKQGADLRLLSES